MGDALVEWVDEGGDDTERREASAPEVPSAVPAPVANAAKKTPPAPTGRHHCKTMESPISAILAESMSLAREAEAAPDAAVPEGSRPFESPIRQIQITENREHTAGPPQRKPIARRG